MIAEELVTIGKQIGKMPSVSYLRETGRNGLMCAITRRGGFLKWSERLGLNRSTSDSDTGWEGEKMVESILARHLLPVSKPGAVKSPYDLLVDGCLRVDVKSARFAEYGYSKGWFYRIGKWPQADVIALLKLDTGDVYWLPWWVCPTTNITITPTGNRYTGFLNRIEVVQSLVNQRKAEMASIQTASEPETQLSVGALR